MFTGEVGEPGTFSFLQNQLGKSSYFNNNCSINSDNSMADSGLFQQGVQHSSLYDFDGPQGALTTLLKYQLKQTTMEPNESCNTRQSSTSMNDILKMIMMAGSLGLSNESIVIDSLGNSSYSSINQSNGEVISDFNNLNSRNQALEMEMQRISEISTSQDRSSLKDSVLSVLYQIIDEVLSDTTSSLPLCWSTSSNNGHSDQLIQSLALKWECDQNLSNNPMLKNLYQFLSKQAFLTNQELIDLMVNSHNLLEESNSLNNQSTKPFNPLQIDTVSNTDELLSLFPSAETFNVVFKSLGKSSQLFSLDNLENTNNFANHSLSESINSSNVSSPNSGTPTHVSNPSINFHSQLAEKKKKSPTDSKKSKVSNATDKKQLFGSFLLKTSSSFDTTKISKTRKSSKSSPTALDKQKLEADFSRGFMNWNWKDSKTPNHEPEIVNN